MRILLSGISGKMGRAVLSATAGMPNALIVAGVDKFAKAEQFNVPVYSSIGDVAEQFDVIIDFSVRESVYSLLPYAVSKKIPCVLATTGYNDEELEYIRKASLKTAVFLSGNMSLGVNVLIKLVKSATAMLKDKADIEITETHHNQKIDAPSGTAKMLLSAVASEQPIIPIYGREGNTGARTKGEVGVHAIRGGTVVGKHEVSFILDNEVITLKHEAESKFIFANGALKSASYLLGKKPGLYNMETML
ncbi:MAG: 4-hydroxy-tetrahydrodipicolinate reductase [Firmicutes bacterium]|nr:4-hydroxy-tetrahydrodipicolinate reductase [Bacillota bacterium]